jgi:hypothetical protein
VKRYIVATVPGFTRLGFCGIAAGATAGRPAGDSTRAWASPTAASASSTYATAQVHRRNHKLGSAPTIVVE